MEPSNPLNQPPQTPPTGPVNPVGPPAPAPSLPPTAPAEPGVQAPTPGNPANPADPGFVSPSVAIYGEPIQTTTPTTPLASTSVPPGSAKRRFGRPKFGLAQLIVIAVIILVGAGAAAYLGYYVPNQPDNMWGESLSNMGKGYDKISSYASTYPSSKGSTLSGSFQTSGDLVADGTINAVSDGSNGSFNLNFSTHGVKTSLDLLAIKSNTKNPDLYVKVDGLNGLSGLLGSSYAGLGSLLSGVSGQWYFVDHSLLDQYTSSASGPTGISKDDVTQVINALNAPTKKYVFTNDKQNMAFVIKQKIGKEKIDGRSTYHYKIGINKTNLKAYDAAVCKNLQTTNIYKLLSGDTKNNSCSDTSDVDKIKDGSTADVWVDTHTRLIHKVRFSDSTAAGSFVDLNQDYRGGNKLPLSVNFQSKDSGSTITGALNMTLDTSSHTINMDGNLKSSGKSNYTGSLKLTLTPSSTPVKIVKPAKSKNIMQLLDDLGFGGLVGAPAGIGSQSNLQ